MPLPLDFSHLALQHTPHRLSLLQRPVDLSRVVVVKQHAKSRPAKGSQLWDGALWKEWDEGERNAITMVGKGNRHLVLNARGVSRVSSVIYPFRSQMAKVELQALG